MLWCLVVGGSKITVFSHNVHYYNTFLPSLTQTARLVSGFMKARLLKNEICCDWLAVPVHCDWRTANQYCPTPYQNRKLSILPYQFRSRDYWTRGSRRTFAFTDIARHIKTTLLLLFFWLNHVLDRMWRDTVKYGDPYSEFLLCI